MLTRVQGMAFRAAAEGNLPGLLEITERFPDISIRNEGGQTLLHVASGKNGSETIVRELIKHNIQLDAVDCHGSTALHYSVVWKHVNITRLLLRAGANVGIPDEHGNQPLWYATRDPERSSEIITLLVESGADPRHKNRNGKSPMDAAERRRIAYIFDRCP